MYAIAFLAIAFALSPLSVRAAALNAPENVDVEGGIYTNDTTPTITWDASAGATWYEVQIDSNGWISMSNVFEYTTGTLEDGWHTAYVRARDAYNNISTSGYVTFEIDTEGPSVPTVSPSSAIEDDVVTIYVTPTGESDTVSCNLYISGSYVGSMTQSGSTFSRDYTFANSGSYSAYAICTDGDGNTTTGTSRTITVSENGSDDSFNVPAVSPSTAVEDDSVIIYVIPTGTLDAVACNLYVSGSYVGEMSAYSSVAFGMSYTFTNSGSYTVYAYCQDEDGNWERGTSRTVTVSEADVVDELNVPAVTPSSTTEDSVTEFTVRPTSDYNVTSCYLYVNGDRVETMNEESTNKFVADYTFNNSGSYTVYAYCYDSSGDSDIGTYRTVTVSDDDNTADEGSLIKTVCGSNSDVNDPCRAVYYYADDGMRHVFPNESTYFSWYSDFDDVIEVSSSFMASLTIGRNITYRPGSVLVNFLSTSEIYAIESPRTLRRYISTSLIESDFGSDWEYDVMNISTSLYNNYVIGEAINSSSDYDKSDEYYSVDSINDIL